MTLRWQLVFCCGKKVSAVRVIFEGSHFRSVLSFHPSELLEGSFVPFVTTEEY